MLHVILLILKILGILLLAIVGLLLVILVTVLLVPIRYSIQAEHGEDLLKLDAKASWLLHVLRTRISHTRGIFHMRVKILWFTLYDNLEPKKPKAERKRVEKVKVRKKVESNGNRNNDEMVWAQKPVKALPETVQQLTEDLQIKKDHQIKDATPAQDIESDTFFQRLLSRIKGIFATILNLKERIKNFFHELKCRLIRLFETATDIKHKFVLVLDFIRDELNKKGFQITFVSLKKILKHILPRKLKSRIVFGTGDPCSTGQALGVMSILYSFYGDNIQIVPDFENVIFEGKHYARGRIRLVTLLIIVIKLILDKRFKQLTKNFKILKEAL